MANVLENENGFTIELATPGYSKEDLKISLKKGVLIIEGKGEDNDSARYARREFGIGGFTKRFRLSENVDRDAVIADYQDGVLKVVLPNRPEDKKRDITIS